MKRVLALFFLSAASLVAARTPVSPEAAKEWRTLMDPRLSPNGQWLVYMDGPDIGFGPKPDAASFVICRSLAAAKELRFQVDVTSPKSPGLKFSPDGRWVLFQCTPESAHPAHTVLFDTIDGSVHELGCFATAEFAGERLLLTQPKEGADTSTLTILTLPDLTPCRITNAQTFAIAPSGTRLGWSDNAKGYVLDLATEEKKEIALSDPKAKWIWSGDGQKLVLQSKAAGKTTLVFLGFETSDLHPTTAILENLPGFPDDCELTAAPARWNDSGAGLLVFLRTKKPMPSGVPTHPELVLWHTKDQKLPGLRAFEKMYPATWLGFVPADGRRFVRLSDPTLAKLDTTERAGRLLGYDLTPYGEENERMAQSAHRQLRDYSLVDLATGRRTPVVSHLDVIERGYISNYPRLNPTGTHVLYQNNDGHFVSFAVATGAATVLTADLPTKFYYQENDPKTRRQLYDGNDVPTFQGWSADGLHALISDGWDVWDLPLQGGPARSLTGDGKSNDCRYVRVPVDQPLYEQENLAHPADLTQAVYFRSFNGQTGEGGFLRWTEKKGAESLHREDARLAYMIARDSGTIIGSRMTSTDYPQWHRVQSDWSFGERLTDVNAQQHEFEWVPKGRYLSYKNVRGEQRHALYFPPVSKDGVPAPAVLEIYKSLTGSYNYYQSPESDIYQHQIRGIGVLKPDIVPRLDGAGQAAVDDVNAALDYAIAQKLINPARLALTGHSFGGYETAFIVSQTNRFKFAFVYSGMTDLWSDSGSLWGGRIPKVSMTTYDQPYFNTYWWDNFDAVLRNSPLFHVRNIHTPLLIVQGTADESVMFQQSVELFTALRQLGREAVLLEYRGHPHSLGLAANVDAFAREAQLVDHYLLGAPAPKWWTDGLSYPLSEAPLVAPPK